MSLRVMAFVAAASVLMTAGCRRNDLPVTSDDEPVPLPGEQVLSFTWNGIPAQRQFSLVRARYDQTGNMTTIESFNDSTQSGKFVLQFIGDEPGRYVHRMYGGPSDSDQVFIRFISRYVGSLPVGRFELTGITTDSLEAEVLVSRYGAIGDTISGTFNARLKEIGSNDGKVTLSGGRFTALRQP